MRPRGPERDGDLQELAAQLASAQKRTRRGALRGLADLDSQAAWSLLVGALADPAGEVADGAQLLLGEMDRNEEYELLLGKSGLHSKSEWVRRRVTEVLGRVRTALAGPALLLALKDKDGEVRRMAAWSLERLAGDGRWPMDIDARILRDLGSRLRVAAEKDRELGVRGRAFTALALLDPAAATALHPTFLRSREPGLRCVALELAASLLESHEALLLLSAAAEGEERMLRGQAQESLARWATRAAVSALIECLASEEDARLRFLLVRRLQALSGFLHRDDVRPWRAWLADQPQDWVPAKRASAAGEFKGKQAEPSTSLDSFSGLELRSRRLTFLIDLSGSMWNPGADGRTRKQVVGEKLGHALESLPEDARFNLIPFTGEPHPWEAALMLGSKRNKGRALEFFAKCNQRGSGNFWAAAMLAMQDPEVDTLVMLSDGAPSGGQRYELELIVTHFQELNLTRRVALDSVLVDATPRLQRYWRQLAEGTGGESISVVFP